MGVGVCAPGGVEDAEEGLGVRRVARGEEHNLELPGHVLEERLRRGLGWAAAAAERGLRFPGRSAERSVSGEGHTRG